MRSTVIGLVLVGVLAGDGSWAAGQDEDVGKQVVKGLLRALIESQLDRDDRRGGRDSLRPGFPGQPSQPGNGRPGNIPPSRPGFPPGASTAEIQQLRPLIRQFSQQATVLTSALNSDVRRHPEAREYLADAVRLQGSASVLQQLTDQSSDHRSLIDRYRQLDQSWRTLSHRMSHCDGLSAGVSTTSTQLTRTGRQFCEILGIAEQFDSRELVRAADMLTADLRDLVDEIQHELPPSSARSRQVVTVQQLRNQAAFLANLAADGGSMASVVAEYQRLYASWKSVGSELISVRNWSVSRSVQHIEETHRRIHELLRLSMPVDSRVLLGLVRELEREVNSLFRSITLQQMMDLPDSTAVMSSADQLSGTLQNLTDLVERGEPAQQIGEAWVFLDDAWQLFRFYTTDLRDAETRRALEGIQRSLEGMQRTLGITVGVDGSAITDQALRVESLASSLNDAVRRWAGRPNGARADIRVAASRLLSESRELRSDASRRRETSRLLRECDQVVGIWQGLRPGLAECRTEEADVLRQLSAQLTSELIRLRTMLGS